MKQIKLWLIALFCFIVFQSMAQGLDNPFGHLIAKDGIQFVFPESPRGNDHIWVKVKDYDHQDVINKRELIKGKYVKYWKHGLIKDKDGKYWISLHQDNIGRFFQLIDSPAKAFELCQLLHWGAIVEDEAQFQQILELYKRIGFSLDGQKDNSFRAKFNPSDRSYGIITVNHEDQYEIRFTAYQNADTMGAQASLSRYHYRVTQDGKIELKEKNDYLEGPVLNWQCMSSSSGCGTLEDMENREALRKGVYQISPQLIPPGINLGYSK